MSYCPNCGSLLPDDSKFCQYCGAVLSRNVPETDPAHASAGSGTVSPDAIQKAPAYAVPPAAQASATAQPPAASGYAAPPAAHAGVPAQAPAAPGYAVPPVAQASATAQAPAAPAYAAQPGTQFDAQTPATYPVAAPSPAAAPGVQNPGNAARQTHKIKKTQQCKACGADIDPRTRKCTACGKPVSRVQPTALALAAVSVLLVFSLAINLLQYVSAARIQQELESRNATITAQESAILELEDQLNETEEELQRSEAQLLVTERKLTLSQKDAHNYSLIRSFVTKPDAGYASDQFFASKSVLILSMTGGEQTFSLTTGFSGGEYSFSTTGNSASVSFTENTWYNRTTIRVSPKSTGATYITFSNSLNSQTFRVLVIVT